MPRSSRPAFRSAQNNALLTAHGSRSRRQRAGVRLRSLAAKEKEENNFSNLSVSPHANPLPGGEEIVTRYLISDTCLNA
jgi:hypothetical protein